MRASTPRRLRPRRWTWPYAWLLRQAAVALPGIIVTAMAGVAGSCRASAQLLPASSQPAPTRLIGKIQPSTGAATTSAGAPTEASRANLSGWDAAQAAQCTVAIQAAEAGHALPAGLLGAIAKTESGRPIASFGDVRAWPWTIDADGQGLFFDSKDAAVAWARQGLARGVRLMDVGCMQVNLQMHPDAFRSIEDAFDPVANAEYAARYLRQLQVEAGGDWNVAVGLYHSHTPELAAAYRDRVAQVGAGIVTGVGAPEPLYIRAIRQGTLHLALAGGGMLVLNLNRQPRSSHALRPSPCQVAAVIGPLLVAPARIKGCRSQKVAARAD